MKKSKLKSLTYSQAELVTYALFLLGGDQRQIDTEDVAIQAHKLAPARFSWQKYPDQVNLELVRVFLSDAKKRVNGSLVSGSGRTGWSLTSRGVEWAASPKRGPALAGLTSEPQRVSRTRSVDANRRQRERVRLLGSVAWARWFRGDSPISEPEAREVFRIDSYSDEEIQRSKLVRLRGLFASEPEVSRFLNDAAKVLGIE